MCHIISNYQQHVCSRATWCQWCPLPSLASFSPKDLQSEWCSFVSRKTWSDAPAAINSLPAWILLYFSCSLIEYKLMWSQKSLSDPTNAIGTSHQQWHVHGTNCQCRNGWDRGKGCGCGYGHSKSNESCSLNATLQCIDILLVYSVQHWIACSVQFHQQQLQQQVRHSSTKIEEPEQNRFKALGAICVLCTDVIKTLQLDTQALAFVYKYIEDHQTTASELSYPYNTVVQNDPSYWKHTGL